MSERASAAAAAAAAAAAGPGPCGLRLAPRPKALQLHDGLPRARLGPGKREGPLEGHSSRQ